MNHSKIIDCSALMLFSFTACQPALTSVPPSSPSPIASESLTGGDSATPQVTKISFESPVPGYPKVLIPGVELEVVAGSLTESGFKDGQGQEARFNGARSLVPDGDGGFFFADYNNHALRHLDKTFNVTTILGGEAKIGMGDFENTYIFEAAAVWREKEILYLIFGSGIYAELNLKTHQSRLLGYTNQLRTSLEPVLLKMLDIALEKTSTYDLFLKDSYVGAYAKDFFYISDYVNNLSPTISRLNIKTGKKTYYTGVDTGIEKMHDGPREMATFIAPDWWQFDDAGNMYLLDGTGNATVVRKISAIDQSVTTILGSESAKNVGHPNVNYYTQELGAYNEVNWWHDFLYVTEPFMFLGSYHSGRAPNTPNIKVGHTNLLVELFKDIVIADAWAEGDDLYLLASDENGNIFSATVIYKLSLKRLEQALLAQRKGAQ